MTFFFFLDDKEKVGRQRIEESTVLKSSEYKNWTLEQIKREGEGEKDLSNEDLSTIEIGNWVRKELYLYYN